MSHSYRKPYSSITGHNSAADDKLVARRNVRHRENQVIRDCFLRGDWEEVFLPARYECSYNDVWSWGRDGKQRFQFPPEYPYDWLLLFDEEIADSHYNRCVEYYEKLKRK